MGSDHAAEHKIRVVNISAAEILKSYLTNHLSQTVKQWHRAGITVVCAVGNAGHVPGHPGPATRERSFMHRR